jgi:hypothetical protein
VNDRQCQSLGRGTVIGIGGCHGCVKCCRENAHQPWSSLSGTLMDFSAPPCISGGSSCCLFFVLLLLVRSLLLLLVHALPPL